MKLIPDDLRAKIPSLYAQETVTDPIAFAKIFTPDAGWTWYVTEIASDGDEAFGLVVSLEVELGYFSITEIEGVRGSLGLPAERDLFFTPTPLSVVRSAHRL